MIEDYDSELVDQADGVTWFVDHSKGPSKQLGKGFRICRRSGRPTWKVVQHSRSPAGDMLGLMLVNRQVSAEATTSFYSNIIFSGCPSLGSVLSSFIRGIGPFRRSLIKKIELEDRNLASKHTPLDFGIFGLLCMLEHLDQISIETSTWEVMLLLDNLAQGGINKFTGRVQIVVSNTVTEMPPGVHNDVLRYVNRKRYVWECAKGETEWKASETDYGIWIIVWPC